MRYASRNDHADLEGGESKVHPMSAALAQQQKQRRIMWLAVIALVVLFYWLHLDSGANDVYVPPQRTSASSAVPKGGVTPVNGDSKSAKKGVRNYVVVPTEDTDHLTTRALCPKPWIGEYDVYGGSGGSWLSLRNDDDKAEASGNGFESSVDFQDSRPASLMGQWKPKCDSWLHDVHVPLMKTRGARWLMFIGDTRTRHFFDALVHMFHLPVERSTSKEIFFHDQYIICEPPASREQVMSCKRKSRPCAIAKTCSMRAEQVKLLWTAEKDMLEHDGLIVSWHWAGTREQVENLFEEMKKFSDVLPSAVVLEYGLMPMLANISEDSYRAEVTNIMCHWSELYSLTRAKNVAVPVPPIIWTAMAPVDDDKVPAGSKEMVTTKKIIQWNNVARKQLTPLTNAGIVQWMPIDEIGQLYLKEHPEYNVDGIHYRREFYTLLSQFVLNSIYSGSVMPQKVFTPNLFSEIPDFVEQRCQTHSGLHGHTGLGVSNLDVDARKKMMLDMEQEQMEFADEQVHDRSGITSLDEEAKCVGVWEGQWVDLHHWESSRCPLRRSLSKLVHTLAWEQHYSWLALVGDSRMRHVFDAYMQLFGLGNETPDPKTFLNDHYLFCEVPSSLDSSLRDTDFPYRCSLVIAEERLLSRADPGPSHNLILDEELLGKLFKEQDNKAIFVVSFHFAANLDAFERLFTHYVGFSDPHSDERTYQPDAIFASYGLFPMYGQMPTSTFEDSFRKLVCMAGNALVRHSIPFIFHSELAVNTHMIQSKSNKHLKAQHVNNDLVSMFNGVQKSAFNPSDVHVPVYRSSSVYVDLYKISLDRTDLSVDGIEYSLTLNKLLAVIDLNVLFNLPSKTKLMLQQAQFKEVSTHSDGTLDATALQSYGYMQLPAYWKYATCKAAVTPAQMAVQHALDSSKGCNPISLLQAHLHPEPVVLQPKAGDGGEEVSMVGKWVTGTDFVPVRSMVSSCDGILRTLRSEVPLNWRSMQSNGYKWIVLFGDTQMRHIFEAYVSKFRMQLPPSSNTKKEDFLHDLVIHCSPAAKGSDAESMGSCSLYRRKCTLTQDCGNAHTVSLLDDVYIDLENGLETNVHFKTGLIDGTDFLVSFHFASKIQHLHFMVQRLRRLQISSESHDHPQPSMVVANFGLYSLKGDGKKSSAAYAAGVRDFLCNWLALPRPVPLLWHGLPASHTTNPHGGVRNEDVEKYNDVAMKLFKGANTTHMIFLDTYDMSKSRKDLARKDGLHYSNTFGSALVAQHMAYAHLYPVKSILRSELVSYSPQKGKIYNVKTNAWSLRHCDMNVDDVEGLDLDEVVGINQRHCGGPSLPLPTNGRTRDIDRSFVEEELLPFSAGQWTNMRTFNLLNPGCWMLKRWDAVALNKNGYRWIVLAGDSLMRHIYEFYVRITDLTETVGEVGAKYHNDHHVFCDDKNAQGSDGTGSRCRIISRNCTFIQSLQGANSDGANVDPALGEIDPECAEHILPADLEEALRADVGEESGQVLISWYWLQDPTQFKDLVHYFSGQKSQGLLPDLLVWNSGLHPLLQRYPLDKYEEAMQSAICAYRESPLFSSVPLLWHDTTATVEKLLPSHKEHMTNTKIQLMNSRAGNLLQTIAAGSVDAYSVSSARPDLNLGDGVHYTFVYDKVIGYMDLTYMYSFPKKYLLSWQAEKNVKGNQDNLCVGV